MNVDK
jgi:hypothetical protein